MTFRMLHWLVHLLGCACVRADGKRRGFGDRVNRAETKPLSKVRDCGKLRDARM